MPLSDGRPPSYHTYYNPEHSPSNEHTPLFPAKNPEYRITRSTLRKILLNLTILLLLIPLSAFLGAYTDRQLNQDPADPRVRNRIRQEWESERQQVSATLDEYHREETELRARVAGFEHELHEKIERERRARERLRLYWGDLQGADPCLGNGKRGYTARLENLDSSVDSIIACKSIPITIHGITYDSPEHCKVSHGFGGGTYGYWTVRNDPLCSSYWKHIDDKGCTASKSGLRRFESPIGSVRSGDDAQIMCFSTPATILGQRFERPLACPYSIISGYWGIWDVPDHRCN